MVRKINNNLQLLTQNPNVHRVNRRVIIFCIVALIIAAMACNSNPHFGILTTPDYDPEIVIIVEDSEPISEDSEQTNPNNSASMPETANQPGDPQSSEALTNNVGINEYSVSAQDFNCICQVNGNVNIELRLNQEQLEIVHPNGEVEVFEKIGENTYKKTWMGYYIDTTGGKETKVDQERSAVIILNNDGYMLEHYQGSESSPCCIYTYTKVN
jgi:hypothetical protein